MKKRKTAEDFVLNVEIVNGGVSRKFTIEGNSSFVLAAFTPEGKESHKPEVHLLSQVTNGTGLSMLLKLMGQVISKPAISLLDQGSAKAKGREDGGASFEELEAIAKESVDKATSLLDNCLQSIGKASYDAMEEFVMKKRAEDIVDDKFSSLTGDDRNQMIESVAMVLTMESQIRHKKEEMESTQEPPEGVPAQPDKEILN